MMNSEMPHPLEIRDLLQKPCSKCGKPTNQQYVPVSRRGNFRHGGTKIVVRPVGEVCQCEKPEQEPTVSVRHTGRGVIGALSEIFGVK